MASGQGRDGDARFREFAAACAPRLHRLAYAWSRDWHRADDLVQETLERVYVRWRRVGDPDEPFAYARRTMLHLLLSEQRRMWRSREVTGGPVLEQIGPDVDHAGRMDMVDAVALLPPRQRVVVLLRYVEDLPVADVARLLSCSEGTVKSQAHAAMATLRHYLAPSDTGA